MFEVSEDFYPLCLPRILRKLADLGACFKVVSAVFRYRNSEIVSSLNGSALALTMVWCICRFLIYQRVFWQPKLR